MTIKQKRETTYTWTMELILYVHVSKLNDLQQPSLKEPVAPIPYFTLFYIFPNP